MDPHVFTLAEIELAGRTERVLAGGRHLFPLLPRAFAGVSRIGVLGWGSQGRAQALNLRDSLTSTGIRVTVGLRPDSASRDAARAEGFTEADGTLGDLLDVAAASDLVLLLIADAALAETHETILGAVRPGAVVGLSHGYLLEHLRAQGRDLPGHVSVVAVCPKGMGPSVRRLYEQGRDTDGAGINASVAVHRDLDGRAADVALGWAVALGAPFVFPTTLESECRSDVVGERAILLAIPHAIAEAVYRRRVEAGDDPHEAFRRSTESMTGPLARMVSRGGLRAVLDAFVGDQRATFEHAYCAAHRACTPLIAELYEEVASGNELTAVAMATTRLARHPMPAIDGSRMWAVGHEVRLRRGDVAVPVDPLTAGLFCGAMVAQIDVLHAAGHPWSEIANESVTELVDSLIPYMHARGVAYMVDNCSVTARLGARKWAPRFEAALTQQALPAIDAGGARDVDLVQRLLEHPIHDVLATLGRYRPSIDVAVL